MEQLKIVARRLGVRRSTVASLRMRAEREVMARRHRPTARPGGRILAYHSVGTPSWGVNDVSPAQFRRHLELAEREGFRFVAPDEIVRTGGRPGDLAITFDDGITTVATNAAPILAERGIPWSLFVVTAWTDGHHGFGDGTVLDWAGLERLVDDPLCTIGSHSCTHPRFSMLDRPTAADELTRSRSILEERLGILADTFAIPLGQSGDWNPMCQEIGAATYRVVYAQAEETRTPGTVGRTFVSRFDDDRVFVAALHGAFDRWEEWV